MPEVVRHLAARLRQFVGNRRSAPRHEVRLRCAVGLLSGKAQTNGTRRLQMLEGHTRDLSASGLGLLLPAIHIGGHYLTGTDSTLLIELELPDGALRMKAVAVRYERIEQDEVKTGYLIGARIAEMSEEERARFVAYLKACKS